MARKRVISPEFFTSATVNALKVDCAMTFIGLWCYADDDGRAEDDADLIKATVWPRRRNVSAKRVGEHLTELASHGVICRYSVNSIPLLHVTAWREHQKISHPTPSRLAPCELHEPAEWDEFVRGNDTRRDRFRDFSGMFPEGFRSDSTPIELKAS